MQASPSFRRKKHVTTYLSRSGQVVNQTVPGAIAAVSTCPRTLWRRDVRTHHGSASRAPQDVTAKSLYRGMVHGTSLSTRSQLPEDILFKEGTIPRGRGLFRTGGWTVITAPQTFLSVRQVNVPGFCQFFPPAWETAGVQEGPYVQSLLQRTLLTLTFVTGSTSRRASGNLSRHCMQSCIVNSLRSFQEEKPPVSLCCSAPSGIPNIPPAPRPTVGAREGNPHGRGHLPLRR